MGVDWNVITLLHLLLYFCFVFPYFFIIYIFLFADYVEHIWNGRGTSARLIYIWTIFALYKFVGEFYL